ncbi:MAG TPA: hypothetical protein ENI76_01340 [Ignavibacteria bacterium]|nr:hypothetical protein [Ignavibacteria bacterium]
MKEIKQNNDNLSKREVNHKKTLEFVVDEVKKICLKKDYSDAIIKCSLMSFNIQKLDKNVSVENISNLRNEIYDLIDELNFIIQIEIRFVLFPLPDIKREAYEIGKNYMQNFLEWIKAEDNYSPEKLMKILEDESYRLEEMKDVLDNIKE